MNKTEILEKAEEQEIVQLNHYAEQIRDKIFTMAINSVQDYKQALEYLLRLSVIKLELENKRQFFAKPLHQQFRRVNEYFERYLKPIEEADKVLRQKIVEYRAQRQQQLNEQLQQEYRIDELPVIITPTLAKHETVSAGEITFRVVKKWEIEDENKLPRQFLKPDEKKISEAVKGGEEIPGVKIYTIEEPQVKIL